VNAQKVARQWFDKILTMGNRYLPLWDGAMLSILPMAALALRLGWPGRWLEHWPHLGWALGLYVAASLLVRLSVFHRLGLYRRCWRYASVGDLVQVGIAVGASSAVMTVLVAGAQIGLGAGRLALPDSLPALDAMLTLIGVAGLRISLRALYTWRYRRWRPVLRSGLWRAGCRRAGLRSAAHQGVKRTLIVGAGEAGIMIAREMRASPKLGLEPVAFVDDDPAKVGTFVQGLPVVGSCTQIRELIAEYQRANGVRIERAVVAIPSAPLPRQIEWVALCEQAGVDTYNLPGVYELLAGYKAVSRLPQVDPQKLLHRSPIQIDQKEMAAYLTGATVLVTGAGGSIGSELCRQIAPYRPARLVLLGRGENSVFEIQLNLRLTHPDLGTVPVVADVRDEQRTDAIVAEHRPDVILHAAAHKHVPLMENAVDEALANNVLGTRNVLQAAARHGVSRFVLISTDKAVNPSNVMGATKRLAELLVQATARRTGRSYAAVRFGNVLGSRGSVIPIFQRQIAAGGPVTVTHPEMTRYFMTIPEAAQLVLGAGGMARGGEVFVLDMGQPVRIADLAADMIRQCGLRQGRDIQVVYSGIRPGEKLDEELFTTREVCQRTACRRIMVGTSASTVPLEPLERLVSDLHDLALNQQAEGGKNEVRALLLDICNHTERYLPVIDLEQEPEKVALPASSMRVGGLAWSAAAA
jgi:FlaA1/EpsC-like NDP-sugar epimerase